MVENRGQIFDSRNPYPSRNQNPPVAFNRITVSELEGSKRPKSRISSIGHYLMANVTRYHIQLYASRKRTGRTGIADSLADVALSSVVSEIVLYRHIQSLSGFFS